MTINARKIDRLFYFRIKSSISLISPEIISLSFLFTISVYLEGEAC